MMLFDRPFFVHIGLLATAIYGGRIDSATDSGVMHAHIARVFDPRVLSGARTLPGAPAPLQPLLPGGTASAATVVGGAKRIADMLPDTDTPATFGLAPNVDRAELEAAAAAAVAALRGLSVQQIDAGSGEVDRGVWRRQLGPIVKTWEGLLQGSRPVQAARRFGRKESLRRLVRSVRSPACLLRSSSSGCGARLCVSWGYSRGLPRCRRPFAAIGLHVCSDKRQRPGVEPFPGIHSQIHSLTWRVCMYA